MQNLRQDAQKGRGIGEKGWVDGIVVVIGVGHYVVPQRQIGHGYSYHQPRSGR